MQEWILILLLSLLLIATMSTIYFTSINEPDATKRWGYWALGLTIFLFVLAVGILVWYYCYYQPRTLFLKKKYIDLREQIKQDPECKPPRQICREKNIQEQRQLKSMSLSTSQKDILLQEKQKQLNQCDKESASSDCTQILLDVCSELVDLQSYPKTKKQFNDFKGSHAEPEVINLCNIIVQK